MIISGVTVICFCIGEVHMQLTINTPENFNIYDHMSELKAQGFMLLSFIKQEFGEAKKIKIKTKSMAQKLGVHVSTLRRWIKRLIALGFAELIKKMQSSRNFCKKYPGPRVKSNGNCSNSSLASTPAAWAPDHSATRSKASCLPPSGVTAVLKDPLEYLIDTLTPMEAAALRLKLRAIGLNLGEEDTDNKPKLKQLLLTNPEYLKELVDIYEFRQERFKQRKIQHEARLKQISDEKEKYGDRMWHKMYVPRVGLS